MRVIDLLNKIANGEEVRFKLDGELYHCYKYGNLYDEVAKKEVEWYISEDWLNEEVEIIEEDKKIEKFEFGEIEDREHYEIKRKINEIIDYINGGIND